MSIILRKNVPHVVTKDSPIKRGDKINLRFNFEQASEDEVRKALGGDAPEGYVAGWASTSGRDLYNHEVMAGAFQGAIDKRGLKGPQGIKLLLDHEWDKPAGVITTLEYRRGKLWIEAQMDLEVGYVKDRWRYLKMMGGANFSVGFILQDYQVVTRQVDGEEESYLQIDRGDLFEVSIVLFPGNEEATMTFVKAALHEDNPSEDKLFFAKANAANWRMGASRNLPLAETESWDGAAAKARVFRAAGFDGDNPDVEMARKAFLAYDAANPELRGSYKLPFADIIDGRLQATTAGINAAASRLPQTDIPDSVRNSARNVLDHYQEREAEEMTKHAPSSLAEFEKMLLAKGLVKSRNDARAVALVAKSCPQLFQKKVEDIRPPAPSLDEAKLTEMLVKLKRLNASIAPVAQS